MPIPDQAWIAFGAIVAATIAGFFSYINLIASKETKLSEFRQVWIDALRSDISTLLSRLRALADLDVNLDEENASEVARNSAGILAHKSELYREAQEAYQSIYLRINPKEEKSTPRKINKNFLDAIYAYRESFYAGKIEDLGYLEEQVVKHSNQLLKFEWNRVRAGEPSFRRAKRLAIIMLTVSVIAAAWGVYAIGAGHV